MRYVRFTYAEVRRAEVNECVITKTGARRARPGDYIVSTIGGTEVWDPDLFEFSWKQVPTCECGEPSEFHHCPVHDECGRCLEKDVRLEELDRLVRSAARLIEEARK